MMLFLFNVQLRNKYDDDDTRSTDLVLDSPDYFIADWNFGANNTDNKKKICETDSSTMWLKSRSRRNSASVSRTFRVKC